MSGPADRREPPDRPIPARRVFWALTVRDLVVVRREIGSFLVRTALQPLLLTLVFGYLLPRMGFVSAGYAAALLPGILAVSMTFASLQAVALPLVSDFGYTNEIEDRLLAPVPIPFVALQKVVSGALQGVLAALFVLPLARLIMGEVPGLSFAQPLELLAVVALGAVAFSALGLVLGTVIAPQQVGLMFSVIVAPMIMFGCAYYPWRGLEVVPFLQWAVLVNPLVYVAEGLRAALTPDLPHMPLPAVVAALAAISLGLWLVGRRAFLRRAVR